MLSPGVAGTHARNPRQPMTKMMQKGDPAPPPRGCRPFGWLPTLTVLVLTALMTLLVRAHVQPTRNYLCFACVR